MHAVEWCAVVVDDPCRQMHITLGTEVYFETQLDIGTCHLSHAWVATINLHHTDSMSSMKPTWCVHTAHKHACHCLLQGVEPPALCTDRHTCVQAVNSQGSTISKSHHGVSHGCVTCWQAAHALVATRITQAEGEGNQPSQHRRSSADK